MKQLINLLIYLPVVAFAQPSDYYQQQDSAINILTSEVFTWEGNTWINAYDCGTWEQDTTYVTEWTAVDTLGDVLTDARDWVYDEERYKIDLTVTADFAPCGRGTPDIYETIRICSITGIRERKQRVITYRYIPKPKTPYQKAIQKFKK